MSGRHLGLVLQPHALHDAAHRLAAVLHLVNAGDEIEVLEYGEIFVEAEALGHVADLAADRQCLMCDVQAQAGAAAAVGRQQTAQHADGGGLAAAVGTEEAADLAGLDLQIQPFHHLARPEALAQIVDVDDQRGHRAAPAAIGLTVTGSPGLSREAWSGRGLASTR